MLGASDKIVITGGAGFIGGHIAEYFQEKGHNAHPLSRTDADIRDLKALIRAFENADCVIHNAAKAGDWGNYRSFFENNVEGTLNVLKACIERNISFVILTSSCSVYGEEDNALIKDENSPHNSHYRYFADRVFPSAMNYYRDTKRDAKLAAIEFCEENQIDLTIIEPVWVYGEGEFSSGFYEYLLTAKSGLPFVMGSKKNLFHTVYAKDLARAYYLAYKAKLEGINSFLIGSENAEKMDRFLTMLCAEAGIKKPKTAPKSIMYPIGFLMELLYTIAGAKSPPALTRARVNMFYDNIEYSIKKAHDVLGFECRYSLEQGVLNTVKWYKENGYL